MPRQAEREEVLDSRAPSGERVFRYRRIGLYTFFLSATVSIAPLLIMTFINYYQYQKSMKLEMIQPVHETVSNAKRSMESFLAERRSALRFTVLDKSFAALCDQKVLSSSLRDLKDSFGGFVDMGLIDTDGNQLCYVGPFRLKGKHYEDQDWFQEAIARGWHVSDVFMGFREVPHFIIAVRHEKEDGEFYLLRATIDAEMFNELVTSADPRPSSDLFLVNREGLLQTPSRRHGGILEKCTVSIPSPSNPLEVVETYDKDGDHIIMGHAWVEQSPFALVMVRSGSEVLGSWFSLRNKLLWILAVSIIVILVLVLLGSSQLVSRLRLAESQRQEIFHKAEYTNKMASIGRLAAGVAHEINNPLAIINEKAGLMKDLADRGEDFPLKEKALSVVDSISRSVNRCRTITHRLLSFAKRMDVQVEQLDLEHLMKEVMGFQESEAHSRRVKVTLKSEPGLPLIESDRGQLQQVFLNILSNALDAVDEGGKVDIGIARAGNNAVRVTIADDGHGISEELLPHIFEPFLSTKGEYGTGLGLSITHGIIGKLGGKIRVESQVDQGTAFFVKLPVKRSAIEGLL